MKTIKIILTLFIITTAFSCKAQQISEYSTKIIGTWIEDNSSYKLVFLSNGICKEYENSEIITTYNYTIKNESCKNFQASNTIYLEWVDIEDNKKTCFEILNITDDSLSIMIIDKAKNLFFNKQ